MMLFLQKPLQSQWLAFNKYSMSFDRFFAKLESIVQSFMKHDAFQDIFQLYK